MMKQWKKWMVAAALTVSAVCMLGTPALAGEDYTVTANLYVPGELNKQLPGVTAYLTNGANPLGLGGYEAVAPTKPVSGNATAMVEEDGSVSVKVPVPNPVFTLQAIDGCSNADITAAPRDTAKYATQDGKVSRDGRITSITVELGDRSGKYVFSDCTEFPTLLGVDWKVPLTLEVDLSAVPEAAKAEEKQDDKVDDKAESGQDDQIVLQIGQKASVVLGKTVQSDAAPVILDGRTMVPLRFVSEALGAQVNWNAADKTVTIQDADETLQMTIGQEIQGFGAAPVIRDGRTLVPIRYISEKLGAQVAWDDAAQKITITVTDERAACD